MTGLDLFTLAAIVMPVCFLVRATKDVANETLGSANQIVPINQYHFGPCRVADYWNGYDVGTTKT